MKVPRKIFPLLIVILLSSCAGTADPTPTSPAPSYDIFRDGYYQAAIPDWPENTERDPETIHSVQLDGQFISINRYQHLPEIFKKNNFLPI